MLYLIVHFVELDVWVEAVVKDLGKMVHGEHGFKFVFGYVPILFSLLA